eukprot:CAMPEP_0197669682 /NCGR_PEP_ID=MMETSP1338-20131121/72707_1 /TAXON_ID=43686 ORGANISM="Pelagodinium beii, Strain RCC1491" /NCGR_SAMPLE_ID=MMETSP1338 /ASSEMBLY_ACC=CAM_ASM_000754 /LENGTH=268 /DNA_ID=CAMNT_0043249307 /DNA_START=36 /DNA_END=840 /DNA_ORIENTATION=-
MTSSKSEDVASKRFAAKSTAAGASVDSTMRASTTMAGGLQHYAPEVPLPSPANSTAVAQRKVQGIADETGGPGVTAIPKPSSDPSTQDSTGLPADVAAAPATRAADFGKGNATAAPKSPNASETTAAASKQALADPIDAAAAAAKAAVDAAIDKWQADAKHMRRPPEAVNPADASGEAWESPSRNGTLIKATPTNTSTPLTQASLPSTTAIPVAKMSTSIGPSTTSLPAQPGVQMIGALASWSSLLAAVFSSLRAVFFQAWCKAESRK